MDLNNILVEVRTASLDTVGVLVNDDLHLDAEIVRNGVGRWTVALRQDHPLAGVLQQPGAGLVVTDTTTSYTIFSGPTTRPEKAETIQVPMGYVAISGVTDEQVLEDMLAWPDPASSDVANQSTSHDTRSGPAESVMHGFVSDNIGPTGTPERVNSLVMMGEDLGRGTVVTRSARFDNLLELLQDIATPDDITFRLVQVGRELEFQTDTPSDMDRLVRLGGTAEGAVSNRLAQSLPVVTRAIVGGAGGNSSRILHEAVSDDSLATEEEWGRRIERFFDRQEAATLADAEQLGNEVLVTGAVSYAARVEPSEDLRAGYGETWNLGDTVVVTIDDREHTLPITSVILRVDQASLRVGVTLGGDKELGVPGARVKGTSVVDSGHDTTPITTLDQRITDEVNALDQALDAVSTTADGKNRTHYATTEPAGPHTEGDLWFDSNDGFKAYRWDGSAWVSIQDAAIAAAQDTANTAMASANGKNTITYNLAPPTSGINSGVVGDTWYVRNSDGYVTDVYELTVAPSTWVKRPLHGQMIDFLDAAAIKSGVIHADRLGANSIGAEKLLVTPGGANLYPNSSFEDTTAALPPNWGNALREYSTERAFTGSRSVKVSTTISTNTYGIGLYLANSEAVSASGRFQPDRSYVMSTWVYVPAASTGITSVSVGVSGAGVAAGSTKSSVTLARDSWQRHWVKFRTNASGTVTVLVNTNGSPPAGSVMYVDAVQLEEGDLLTSWKPLAVELLPGTIRTEHLAANSITAESGIIASLDLGKATVGELDGARIKADTIAVSSLMVTDLTDYCHDPYMKGVGWNTSTTGVSFTAPTVGPPSGVTNVARITADGTSQAVYAQERRECEAGDQFRLSAYIRRQGTTSTEGFVEALVYWYDNTETLIGSADLASLAATTANFSTAKWVQAAANITAPVGAVKMMLGFRVRNTTAGAVWDFADLHLRRRLAGNLLVDGAINGQTVTGVEILGSTFRTSTGVTDIEMRVNDNAGAILFTTQSNPYNGTQYYDNTDPARVHLYSVVASGENQWSVRLQGAKATTSTATPRIDITTRRNRSTGTVSADIALHAAGGANGKHYFYVDGTVHARVGTDGIWAMNTANSGFKDEQYINSSGQSAIWNSNGRVTRSTSSRRYKEQITPLSRDEWKPVLDLVGQRFKYIPSENLGDGWFPGLIAEQADAAGANLWVTYDEQGIPNGIRYPELVAALIEVCKDQEARISTLEGIA